VAHDEFDDKTRPGSFFGGYGPSDATAVEDAPAAPPTRASAPTVMAPPVPAPPPPPPDDDRSSIFRREAIEAHARPKSEGELLRLSPAWTAWTFYLLIALVGVGAVYSVVGTLHEWARGPAIIRVVGKTPITATRPGSVVTVDVQPGQRVSAGDLLARFYSAEEAAQYEQAKTQYEDKQRSVLRDLNDQGARAQLTDRRAARELAEQRLNEMAFRAPHAGVVSDIRIRAGQSLVPGEMLFSIIGDGASYRLSAFLPGYTRPLLRRGMKLRIEMEGYRYAFREVTIDKVGEEVVGVEEVGKYLGQNPADLGLGGPVVLVEASLSSQEFQADGKRLRYHDGMRGTAEARVKTEMVLVSFIPGLKAVLGGN
jgi:biotin carboxyl carrier protein